MESRFEEFKKIILDCAKKAAACTEQYRRAYSSESFKELTTVIRDNFFWCVNNDVITGELIDEYKQEFADGGIWHNENVTEGYMIATGSATVDASGSATVDAYGSATVRASDNVTVKAFGSATVKAYGSATVEASDNVTVDATGSATVRAFDNVTVEAFDNVTVKASDSATVEAFGSAYVNTISSIECKLSDFAIARVNNDKICYASDNLKFEKIEEQK